MPVKISKIDGKFRVSTPNQTHAFGTTKAKAKRQKNLLNAVDHGWRPTGRPARESILADAHALVDHLLAEDEDTDQDPDKPLERHHTEPTKLRGGRYGKGVQGKGKTSGKFTFPGNYRVGHAIKN